MEYFKNFLFFVIAFSLLFTSCKKEEEVIIEGCTDSNAMNYMQAATSNNGSCIFAYDLAQGIWSITPNCGSIEITDPVFGMSLYTLNVSDLFPQSAEIIGQSQGIIALKIDSDAGIDQSFTADITNDGVITLQQGQSFNYDTGIPFVGDVTVNVSGGGNVNISNTGLMNLDLEFVTLLGTENTSCQIDFFK